ncbi:Rod shape-determining protein MreC [Syntrophomonas zehnderi OL-4]|uniref:Cell shape-determining protein MreC n=1 Tax=Syntrophomonas zehnderi OL-4 TaxID=690567 RepID=A0A0E3W3G4_9FIRM|nr:Rod shape-determining protein MreC [Syntrophomonas zehnderi OL-4]
MLLATMRYTSSTRAEITVAEKLLRDSYAPLQSGLNEMRRGINGLGLHFAEKKNMNAKIKQLNREKAQLTMENQRLQEYEAETLRLRKLLNFGEENKEQFGLEYARVIARSPNNWFKVITIDKGAEDGIAQGMPVISPDGLVGRISNTSQHSAQVTLITDREMAVGVILQDSRETRGIIEGTGDSYSLAMINIPYYAKVKKGEKVITSGLSEFYPKGIQIGTIQSVKRESNGLLLSATVKPAVQFDKLEEVMVIAKYNPVSESGINEGE